MTVIFNRTLAPVTLPLPMCGILMPGKSVHVNATKSQILAALGPDVADLAGSIEIVTEDFPAGANEYYTGALAVRAGWPSRCPALASPRSQLAQPARLARKATRAQQATPARLV